MANYHPQAHYNVPYSGYGHYSAPQHNYYAPRPYSSPSVYSHGGYSRRTRHSSPTYVQHRAYAHAHAQPTPYGQQHYMQAPSSNHGYRGYGVPSYRLSHRYHAAPQQRYRAAPPASFANHRHSEEHGHPQACALPAFLDCSGPSPDPYRCCLSKPPSEEAALVVPCSVINCDVWPARCCEAQYNGFLIPCALNSAAADSDNDEEDESGNNEDGGSDAEDESGNDDDGSEDETPTTCPVGGPSDSECSNVPALQDDVCCCNLLFVGWTECPDPTICRREGFTDSSCNSDSELQDGVCCCQEEEGDFWAVCN